MKDIFGTEIKVGDTIAFNPPVYKGLKLATVIRFTPKMVRVKYMHQGREYETVTLPHDVVVKK